MTDFSTPNSLFEQDGPNAGGQLYKPYLKVTWAQARAAEIARASKMANNGMAGLYTQNQNIADLPTLPNE